MIRHRDFCVGLFALLAGCGSSEAPPASKSVTALDPHKSSAFFAGATDSAGRILAAGYFITDDSSQGQILVARFAGDGSIDPGFGAGGTTYIPISGETYAHALDVIVDASQRTLACGVGYSRDEEGYETTATAVLARLDSSGNLDPAFGNQGLAGLPPQVGVRNVCRGVREAGGHYYMLAENAPPDGVYDVSPYPLAPLRPVRRYGFLIRFDQSGMFDPTFGDAGVHELPSGHVGALLKQDSAARLYVIYGVDHAQDPGSDLLVQRLLPDGQIDATYGSAGSGRVLIRAPEDTYFNAYDAELDDADQLRMAGDRFVVDDSLENGGYSQPMLWQVSNSGRFDETALGRLAEAYRSYPSAYFFRVSSGAGSSMAALAYGSGRVEMVGLTSDGLLAGGGPEEPRILPWDLVNDGNRLLSFGRVVETIDGEPNAAAAIEILPR